MNRYRSIKSIGILGTANSLAWLGKKAFEVAAKSEGGEGMRQSVREEVMRSLGFIPGWSCLEWVLGVEWRG